MPLVVFGIAADCARSALYPFDLRPMPVDQDGVRGEPDGRWLTTHGSIDVHSLMPLGNARAPVALSFRSRELPALLVIASSQRYPELARLMTQERAKLEAPGDQVFSGVLVHLKGARVEYEGQTFALDPDDCDRPNCLDSLALLDGERPAGPIFRTVQGLVALCLAAIAVQLARHTLRQSAAPASPPEQPETRPGA